MFVCVCVYVCVCVLTYLSACLQTMCGFGSLKANLTVKAKDSTSRHKKKHSTMTVFNNWLMILDEMNKHTLFYPQLVPNLNIENP